MHTTFLEKLAQTVYENHPDSLDDLCFVFPSKRAGLFFKKELAKKYHRTMWAPEILTMETFVENLSGLKVISSLEQVFHLFQIHQSLGITPQLPFEKFIDQAKIILADFNDIDMALAPAEQLFGNAIDYIEIGNWTPVNEPKDSLTHKFFFAIDNLPKYYDALQKQLVQENKAYQGMAYRHIKQKVDSGEEEQIRQYLGAYQKVYVAGLNALTEAESWLFDWVKSQYQLEIFFQAEAQMIDDMDQESGLFMHNFFQSEGENFRWKDDLLTDSAKNIHTYSVNGNLAIARTVGKLFEPGNGMTYDQETAIILADENLLIPVLESLPPSIENINITLGFPLGLTPFMSFVEQFFAMQTMARGKDEHRQFFYRDVLKVLSNPILVSFFNSGNPLEKVVQNITKKNEVWLDVEFIQNELQKLSTQPFLEIGFAQWKLNPELSITFFLQVIEEYEKKMDSQTAMDDVLTEQLYFFKNALHQLGQYLEGFSFSLSLEAIRRIFKQIISPQKVPFSGEPLLGIQIMGLLETRLLSFKNVVFLSVNEGIIPNKSGNQSYLPFNLRQAFKIQTHRHRESIFAYHFYRILSQADNIHLIYDNSSTGIGANEKSRFVRQIEQEWPEKSTDIKFSNSVGVFESEAANEEREIQKTEDVLRNIENYLTAEGRGLSPSALNNYLQSPVDFYFKNVIGIQEPDEVAEDMEHNTFGTIVHECLEVFYTPFVKNILSADSMEMRFKDLDDIIKTSFTKQIPSHAHGKHYLAYYSVENYVKHFVQKDMERVRNSEHEIILLDNELKLKQELEVAGKKVIIKGFADRVESMSGITYIIDYKTGGVDHRDLRMETLAVDPENVKPKANQLFMYAWLAAKHLSASQVVSGIYSLREPKMPLLQAVLGENEVLGVNQFQAIESFIVEVIEEMLNPEIPLVSNPDYDFSLF